MPKYTYVARWVGLEESGEVETIYPEVAAMFDNKSLLPSEVSVVTREGIHITWKRVKD